jgi:hypothetical protein
MICVFCDRPLATDADAEICDAAQDANDKVEQARIEAALCFREFGFPCPGWNYDAVKAQLLALKGGGYA